MSDSSAVAVDWAAAGRRARALTRSGPQVDRAEAALLVEALRSAATAAPPLVGAVTGLEQAAADCAHVPVLVTDRPRWIAANLATFEALSDGVMPPAPNRAAARMAGEEIGLVLPLLASRVLGQFDPFAPGGRGRLLLVAPNVLKVQRELGVEAADFQLWVALHEQTHALQFAAAPWLADHLRDLMRQLMSGVLGTDSPSDRLQDFLRALPRVLGEDDSATGPLLGAVLSEDERRLMGQAVAVMSLLEGHADVVMDAVGPQAIPTVHTIRAAFDRRRTSPGPIEAVLRRLLGMEAKLAQYRNGAVFVRAVVEQVGHEGLNAVWGTPENLPTEAEISDPAAWLARVHH